MRRTIEIRGAREHNLTGVDVSLPRERLVVVTGVSGSGKSSLALDTIFREAQRRFLQSFSPHARHYLGRLERPAVASAAGLSPALAIQPRRLTANPRSTVGTLSEVYDHLRLLYARAGSAPCPACGGRVDGIAQPDPGWRRCGACGHRAEAPESRLFSFNAPAGACPECQGLGEQDRVDPELLIADPTKTLRQGALVPTTPTGYIVYSQVTVDVLDELCRAHGFSVDVPWQELDEAQRRVVLYGSDRIEVVFGKHPLESRLKWSGITARPRDTGFYKGLVPTIEQTLRRNRNPNAMRFARSAPCEACGGSRLGPEARAYVFRERTLADLSRMPLDELAAFVAAPPSPEEAPVVAPILEVVGARLALLARLGLSYLTLDRSAPGLSGGEAQRIRLATQVGGRMRGVLYVLDEPSAGLHVRDNRRLLDTLRQLVDHGSSVLVVEHDAEVMRAADWLVDIGPDAGVAGGELLYSGPLDAFLDPAGAPVGAERSHSRAYLIGASRIEPPAARRPGSGVALEVIGARQHNLRSIDVAFRVGALNLVTGVSGSGKSTLVLDVLGAALRRRLHGAERPPGRHDAIRGAAQLDKVIEIDQSPIGRTPRSNPATYTKLFDRVRALFAATDEAAARGYDKGRFSFNARGGRCEACQGAGVQEIGMHFLGDVAVTCGECEGRRFNAETLEIEHRGCNVHDVLEMSIARARTFFADDRVLGRALGALEELGLGYLALGQPSTTLSGGEAQRVKLAAELARPGTGRTLYLLDEPTSGLHDHDIRRLLGALERLVEAGNTVIAIEHHPDVIRVADWVVDLGPEGGTRGGRVVAMGTPEEVARAEGSATAEALRAPRAPGPRSVTAGPSTPESPGPTEIALVGVRTHNLRDVALRLPTEALTVITGVSGSGKSSLALDTLYAEGQRRFTESLSPFARRFMEQLPRPPLASAEGLGPTVAITRRTLAPNPRSTVGTLSEVHELYRLIYSRAGVIRCPEHGRELSGGGCPECGFREPGPLPASRFSFNHVSGSCPTCRGLGTLLGADPEKLVTHPERPLLDGALDGTRTGRFYGERDGQYLAILRQVGATHGLDFSVPWAALDARARAVAMDGTGEQRYDVVWRYRRGARQGEHRFERPWPGFARLVDAEYERKHADARGEALEGLLTERPCPSCGGDRLEPVAGAVTFAGLTLGALCRLTVDEARALFEAIDAGARAPGPDARAREITAGPRRAIGERLGVLSDVGLGYLSLERRAATLSGGEARRLQLSGLLGADLCGVTYVLDEPTIGLHASDTAGLIRVLARLRDLGNTVVVVEHDLDVIRAADHVVELGPGAGERGGRIVAQGAPAQLAASDTATGRALAAAGQRAPSRRPLTEGLRIRGACAHNLADLDVEVPAGGLVAIAGVSGSGKTTLLHDVVHASAAAGRPKGCRALEGLSGFGRVVMVDQAAIGTSPASNPVTYTGLFDRIRALFARTDEARRRGFKKGRFSFSGKAGQCPRCKGHGALRTPMGFLADVWVECEGCRGSRYDAETLAVRYRGHSIAEVLAMTVDEAAALFADDRPLAAGLARFADVGLGYLRLGQPAPTLSGGEAQRLKLVAELLGAGGRGRGQPGLPTLYLLDEPTVGLHTADVALLLRLFAGLCDAGHTLLVVEHHVDVLGAADWVLDLGPGGGPHGGHLVAAGPPAELAAHPDSVTGRWLG